MNYSCSNITRFSIQNLIHTKDATDYLTVKRNIFNASTWNPKLLYGTDNYEYKAEKYL